MDFKYIKLEVRSFNDVDGHNAVACIYVKIDKIVLYDFETQSIVVDGFKRFYLTKESDDKFRKFLNEKVGVFK